MLQDLLLILGLEEGTKEAQQAELFLGYAQDSFNSLCGDISLRTIQETYSGDGMSTILLRQKNAKIDDDFV
jgi:hypothetical protein